MKYTIAIVDDHQLIAKAITSLINRMDDYEVIYEAENGLELIRHFNLNIIPDIVLLDVNMPKMDGYETSLWLKNNYPEVKVLVLTMNDKEEVIVKMLRNGARGYILKDCKPSELKQALDAIVKKGFYYTEYITDKLIKSLNPDHIIDPIQALGLNERELNFIQLACSELTYAEIADQMCVSPRTVDGYRESLFQKLNVKSRVSLALQAIRLGIVPM
ncbi:response regulator transcription factor [Spirosoma sp. SC4-14]|uniref:response regulator transcription factor n=1 Tax=Spirosoma sp. SC4-14 TaxID=3128900 RepID=UPI0030D2C20B